MNIYMIAVIYEGTNVVGYRLADTDVKEDCKFIDVKVSSLKEQLKRKPNAFENIRLIDDEVVGINGSISRYPKINKSGEYVGSGEKNPLVILKRIVPEDVGYVVTDLNARKRNAKNDIVVDYVKKYGVANGKLVERDGAWFISAISGTYKEIDVSEISARKATAVSNKAVKTQDIKYNQYKEVLNDANATSAYYLSRADALYNLTKEQVIAVHTYYVWYTVKQFEAEMGTKKLAIAPGKAAKLAILKGANNWEYGGVIDVGSSGGYCELGHRLRYEHLAQSIVKKEDGKEYLRTVVFGETCASDFFEIPKKAMSKMAQSRDCMSNEIELIVDAVSEDEVDKWDSMTQTFMNLLFIMLSNCRKRGDDNGDGLERLLGKDLNKSIISFLKLGMPVVPSMVSEVSTNMMRRPLTAYEYMYSECYGKLADIDQESEAYVWLKKLIYYYATHMLEENSAYIPISTERTRRDVGGYNKDTRNEFRINTFEVERSLGINGVLKDDLRKNDNEYFSSDAAEIYIEKLGEVATLIAMYKSVLELYKAEYSHIGINDINKTLNTYYLRGGAIKKEDDIIHLMILYRAMKLFETKNSRENMWYEFSDGRIKHVHAWNRNLELSLGIFKDNESMESLQINSRYTMEAVERTVNRAMNGCTVSELVELKEIHIVQFTSKAMLKQEVLKFMRDNIKGYRTLIELLQGLREEYGEKYFAKIDDIEDMDINTRVPIADEHKIKNKIISTINYGIDSL